MAVTVTKTVKSSGGDYTSLSGWEAGQQGNLVTLDEIHQAECYSFADTTAVTLSGWTTDATRYLRIYTPAAERHAGVYSTAKYRLEISGNIGIYDLVADVKIEGLQIKITSVSANNNHGIYMGGGGTFDLSATILRGVLSGTTTTCYGIQTDSNTTGRIWNCLAYDWINGTNDCAGFLLKNSTFTAYNCTAYGNYRNFYRTVGTVTLRNCLGAASGLANGSFIGTYASSNYCASDDTSTPGGANSRTSQTFTFVDAANDDFHLASGDAGAKDFGESDPASGLFADDIDGETRSGSWDIGADEFVAAGAGAAQFMVATAELAASGGMVGLVYA